MTPKSDTTNHSCATGVHLLAGTLMVSASGKERSCKARLCSQHVVESGKKILVPSPIDPSLCASFNSGWLILMHMIQADINQMGLYRVTFAQKNVLAS